MIKSWKLMIGCQLFNFEKTEFAFQKRPTFLVVLLAGLKLSSLEAVEGRQKLYRLLAVAERPFVRLE